MGLHACTHEVVGLAEAFGHDEQHDTTVAPTTHPDAYSLRLGRFPLEEELVVALSVDQLHAVEDCCGVRPTRSIIGSALVNECSDSKPILKGPPPRVMTTSLPVPAERKVTPATLRTAHATRPAPFAVTNVLRATAGGRRPVSEVTPTAIDASVGLVDVALAPPHTARSCG